MPGLIVPTSKGNAASVAEYVAAYLRQMRAPLKESTQFTPGVRRGWRTTMHKPGERVVLGPNGAAIRIVELPEGGNQVEHGDHLHAHVRAVTVTRAGTA